MGIFIFFGLWFQYLVVFIDIMCLYLYILYIEYWEMMFVQMLFFGFFINIYLKLDQLVRVYIDFIDSYKMKLVFFIYEY